MSSYKSNEEKKLNLDPFTGESGAHPIGTAIGAAVGGVTGAAGGAAMGEAVGMAAGPAGAIAGAVVGSVVGGLVGSDFAEDINPTAQINPYSSFKGKPINELEPQPGLEAGQADSSVTWDDAKTAVKDAYDKITGADKDKK